MSKKTEEITLEKVDEFYQFLQGKSVPDGFTLQSKIKMTPKKAFTIIYILQEFMGAFPDTYEQCQGCLYLYDSDNEGINIDDQWVISGTSKPAQKKYWGNWCDDCIPYEVNVE